MRPTLKQLLAEHPDLEKEIEEYNRESQPIVPEDPLAVAESQDILAETWEHAEDVPEMLTPEQADKAMSVVSFVRSQRSASAVAELQEFERSYSEELTRLLAEEREKKDAVAEARAELRAAESRLAEFRAAGTSRRVILQSASKETREKSDLRHSVLARAIAASKKRYVERLEEVRKMNWALNRNAHWDRMAFETQMRKSKVRDAFGITRGRPRTRDEDDEPDDDGYFEPADAAVSQPSRGISLPPMDDHPMIEGPAPTEEPAKKRDPEKVVPWEELAAECLVQPQDYADWSMNYASGWGNNKRIDFARKRILARRVGAEIPDWPEEIIPGLYLGRSKLPTDLARFYSEVPEDKLMKPAGIVPPSDSQEEPDPGIP